MKPAIWRHTQDPTDAAHVNRILNDGSVLPYVSKNGEPLDITEALGSPDFYALFGRLGGQIYERKQPGLFEAHSTFLKEGRGAWALAVTNATLAWMFTHTEAVEILTRCPTLGAKALAKSIGGQHVFTLPEGWVKDGRPIPADVFSLSVQGWMKSAPSLVERGRWFHDRLQSEFDHLGIQEPQHDDSDLHDRYVGAAVEMCFGGQAQKACVFYNRVASLAGWHPISVVDFNPLAIDIGSAILVMRGDDFIVLPPQQQAA
jgi:hypothetical protein